MTLTNPAEPVAFPSGRNVEDLHELNTREEAAQFLSKSVQTLARWKVDGFGPRVTKIGGRAMYRRADLLAFIESSAA